MEKVKKFNEYFDTEYSYDIDDFNKLSHKDKIEYLVDNFGMEKVEAMEICPDNTNFEDLPDEIKGYFNSFKK